MSLHSVSQPYPSFHVGFLLATWALLHPVVAEMASYKWVCLLWSPYVYLVVPVITGGGVTVHS